MVGEVIGASQQLAGIAPMSIQRQAGPGPVTLSVSGELDIASAPALENRIQQAEATEPGTIILDCRELEFIDSTGLVVILRAHQRAEESGRRLILTRVPEQARRIFCLTGIEDRFTIE
jgi:anti-sigma B factor antagonist